ncbi:MAG TPA: endolytic transglycosylase MltG, partial [Rudaea sp.]
MTRPHGKVRLGALFALLALVAIGVAAYFYADYRRFENAALRVPPDAKAIDVPLGTPLPGVVRLLEEQGIAAGRPIYWRILARELGVAGQLHAGEYALVPAMTPRDLLRKMAAGEVVQHHVTIVEGWTFKQLRVALAQETGLKQTLAAVDDDELRKRLGIAEISPEGWFLPETYSYVKGMSDFDVLRRAHEAMQKLLDKLWAEHDAEAALDSPYQALTLASIVEKETARVDERPQIAGVFARRLKLGMKLQTDPTVIYGLGAKFDGNLRKVDLQTDTPWNTYTRGGLPPTPIAMPGKA